MKFVANENVLRAALIVFSVLFGILSVTLVTLGIIYINELYYPKYFINVDFLNLPSLIIILGTVSFLLSILGCICARNSNKRLTVLFILVLTITLGFQVTIAIFAFENINGMKTEDKKLMENAVNEPTLSYVEDHLNCCGYYGNETRCLNIKHNEGCLEFVDDLVKRIATRIGYFDLTLLILEVLRLGTLIYFVIILK